jgi:hypothetical protein
VAIYKHASSDVSYLATTRVHSPTMLLPAYDLHGRLYYPQYEDAPSSRSIANLPDRARRATTRSFSACIDDTFYSFALRQQEEALMGVKPRRPSLKVTSSVVPPPLAPIPKWTGRSDGEKRGRSRKSGAEGVERSCSRDMAGLGPKAREIASMPQCHDVSCSHSNEFHSRADV